MSLGEAAPDVCERRWRVVVVRDCHGMKFNVDVSSQASGHATAEGDDTDVLKHALDEWLRVDVALTASGTVRRSFNSAGDRSTANGSRSPQAVPGST